MSRSNPSAGNTPHPAQRWFEWVGSKGEFKYYDKEKEKIVPVKLPFTFIVLDQTYTIRGYNKKKQTGIYSNEIRDTREEQFDVKYFDGNEKIARGFWSDIKDKVGSKAVGGKFAVNCYVAYKDGKSLKLGAFQIVGCALGPWFDFQKEHKKDLLTHAVVVKEFVHDDSGAVEFNSPVYELVEISEASNLAAVELDKELQTYLEGYFQRTRITPGDPAERPQEDAPADDDQEPPKSKDKGKADKGKKKKASDDDAPPEEDDVPF
jgi:hypothetical protein